MHGPDVRCSDPSASVSGKIRVFPQSSTCDTGEAEAEAETEAEAEAEDFHEDWLVGPSNRRLELISIADLGLLHVAEIQVRAV